MDIAVQDGFKISFMETDVRISYSTQSTEMVIGALEVIKRIERTTLQESIVIQHRLAKGDYRIVWITTDKFDITDGVHLMGQITLLATTVLIQYKCDVDEVTIRYGISHITDKILIKTIIASISKIMAYAGTFIVEISHIEHHA